jgi:hypothetical protein
MLTSSGTHVARCNDDGPRRIGEAARSGGLVGFSDGRERTI